MKLISHQICKISMYASLGNFLCNILNLQWNPLFQGTREPRAGNYHMLTVKKLTLSIRRNHSGKDFVELVTLWFTQSRNSLRSLTRTLRSKCVTEIWKTTHIHFKSFLIILCIENGLISLTGVFEQMSLLFDY